MDDLDRYVEVRSARDPEFAAGLESGYQEFRIGVERYAMAVGLTLAIDLRPEGARTA